jgi:hypothetical protein
MSDDPGHWCNRKMKVRVNKISLQEIAITVLQAGTKGKLGEVFVSEAGFATK